MSTKGMTCFAYNTESKALPGLPGGPEDRLWQVLIVALDMYSSMRWPPIAVFAIPIGWLTPSSDNRWAKYQPDQVESHHDQIPFIIMVWHKNRTGWRFKGAGRCGAHRPRPS